MTECEICRRREIPLTRHHLLPQARHNKPRFARNHTKEEGRTRIALLCKSCHSFVHAAFTEKQLEQSFNTIDSLQAHPEVAKFAAWISTKPAGFQALSRRLRSRS
jgi:5-methylcytosine-specific restriction endonuclease McrA